MTEDEAKQRYCPFRFEGATTHRCIGADCMAWRVSEPQYEECTTDLGAQPRAAKPASGKGQWHQIERRRDDYGLRWRRQIALANAHCSLMERKP